MEQKLRELIMKNKIDWRPLKLRAEDDSDLLVFSECIYNAILLPSELNYDYKSKQFAMAIERFTWESAGGKDYNLMQVLSILLINGVEKVETKYYFKSNTINNLISISNIDNNILILLNDDQVLNLKVIEWSCILRDVGKPCFPAVTPIHLKND